MNSGAGLSNLADGGQPQTMRWPSRGCIRCPEASSHTYHTNTTIDQSEQQQEEEEQQEEEQEEEEQEEEQEQQEEECS